MLKSVQLHPNRVKIAVALALGLERYRLETHRRDSRERSARPHLTYGAGRIREIVAFGTNEAPDLPRRCR